MAIDLNDVTSGYSTGVINTNFQKVEDEVNDNVLRRDGLSFGEANQMEVNLDMNSNSILNVQTDLTDPGSLVSLGDADTRYVFVSGSTMTGNLDMGGNDVTNISTVNTGTIVLDGVTVTPSALTQLISGIFDNTTKGLAATSEGDYFSTPSGDSNEFLILYRHDAGPTATQIAVYPSVAGVQATDLTNNPVDSATGTAQALGEALDQRGIYVETLADLQALETSDLEDGQSVYVSSLNKTYSWDSVSSTFDFEYDLFVIYGQSNAVGFAGNTPGRGEIPPECYYWTNRVGTPQWNVVEHEMIYVQPGGADSTGHAWIEFAREYTERTGRGVLFLPAAFGGKTIDELSSGSTYYDRLVLSIDQIDADTTYPIRKKILLWCQGESDMSAGTTREQYQTSFVTLWNTLKTDIGVEHAYVSRVGAPQDRAETSRYPIQVAQDYVCAQIVDVSMAFDGAASFTASNFMLNDGVHYTQRGYNLMGREMGRYASERESDLSAITSKEAYKYNSVITPGDVVHRQVGATLEHDGVSWNLKSLTDGDTFRASFVQSISVDSDRIVLTLPMRVQDIISVSSSLNDIGNSFGISASVDTGASNNVLVVYLRSTISAFVDTSSGAVSYPPNGSGTNSGLLADLSANIDAGITKLTYKGCSNTPLVHPHDASSLADFTPVAQKTVSATEVWFKYQTVPTDDRAIVQFTNKKIDPSLVSLTGLVINISAIIGERAL